MFFKQKRESEKVCVRLHCVNVFFTDHSLWLRQIALYCYVVGYLVDYFRWSKISHMCNL